MSKDVEVVGIDEAQFFDDDIVEVCNTLANSGKRVIVTGLDMDFKGEALWPDARSDGHCRIRYKGSCDLH